MAVLGVNIDHVATVRQARQTIEPDPVWAATLAELGGADGITIHLREDRRHIQQRDLRILRQTVAVKLNLEIACDQEVVKIACEQKPEQVTLVPEKREELTTEGGLDVVGNSSRVADAIRRLRDSGIVVSLFLDPEISQIEAGKELGAEGIELHTGRYAQATESITATGAINNELDTLREASRRVVELGMDLHAGHGLTYRNVRPIAAIDQMQELNIGHSIIARAVMVGMERAVREMKALISSPY